jgi:hypothetical protein
MLAQKRAPPGRSAPQEPQVSATRAPHPRQNLAWGGLSCWHRGHVMPEPSPRVGAGNGRTGGESLGWQFRSRQGRMGPGPEHLGRPGRDSPRYTGRIWDLIRASPWRLRIPVPRGIRVRAYLLPLLQADSQSGGPDPTLRTLDLPDSTAGGCDVRRSRARHGSA